jgi:hypothetical protein
MKNRLLIAAGCIAAIVGVRVLIAAPGWFKERRDHHAGHELQVRQ